MNSTWRGRLERGKPASDKTRTLVSIKTARDIRMEIYGDLPEAQVLLIWKIASMSFKDFATEYPKAIADHAAIEKKATP